MSGQKAGFIEIPILILMTFGMSAVSSLESFDFQKYLINEDAEKQALESRIAQLEEQLSESPESSEETPALQKDVISLNEESESSAQEAPGVSQKHSSPSSDFSIPITPSVSVENPTVIQEDVSSEAVRAECEASRTTVFQDEYLTLELKIFFEQRSDYEIEWSKKPTKLDKPYKAQYKFGTPGDQDIDVLMTRGSDGYTARIMCPKITVQCSEYSCLSVEEKQILSLKNILEEIDTWYDGEYQYLGPVDRCFTSESIIRGYLYQYETVLGGSGAPMFSAEQDCSNMVGPRAYQAKIELLLGTF